MRIYVSGPISNGEDCDELTITENLKEGIRISVQLQLKGYQVLSPFLMSPYWVEGGYTYLEMMACSYALLLEADAIFMIPGWSQSEGARREHGLAEQMGKLIFYSLDEL